MKFALAALGLFVGLSSAQAFELTAPLAKGVVYNSGEPVTCDRFASFLLEANYGFVNKGTMRLPAYGHSVVRKQHSVLYVELAFYGGDGGHAGVSSGAEGAFSVVRADSSGCTLSVEEIW